jgi:hypothetical protein
MWGHLLRGTTSCLSQTSNQRARPPPFLFSPSLSRFSVRSKASLMPFPYAVFQCHMSNEVSKAYVMTLRGLEGAGPRSPWRRSATSTPPSETRTTRRSRWCTPTPAARRCATSCRTPTCPTGAKAANA